MNQQKFKICNSCGEKNNINEAFCIECFQTDFILEEINVVSDKDYKPSAIVDQCLVEIPMLIREDGTVCYENLHMIRKEDFENVN